ncbi:MAG: glycosyltransferase family 9 protein [Planctomycetota bacterium]
MNSAPLLIIKTGALGDVLRTTSILPGLRKRFPDRPIEWLTATAAEDLVRTNPHIDRVHRIDPKDESEVERCLAEWGDRDFSWILSFDDEEPLCRLASSLRTETLSGAYLDGEGQRVYSEDVAPWFEMGLLSTLGKDRADEKKIANRRTHPEIFAEMLGIEAGEPQLLLPQEATQFAERFAARWSLGSRLLVGLNTGAGGRWHSKQLPVERTVELACRLAGERADGLDFLVLGGPAESERSAAILAGLARTEEGESGLLRGIDAGVDNSLLEFAALVSFTDLVISSDSLAMHVAIAQRVPVVCFFAPTSAAEIELYGRGAKVASTSPDACTYRADVDTSTLTTDRLAEAARPWLPVRAS